MWKKQDLMGLQAAKPSSQEAWNFKECFRLLYKFFLLMVWNYVMYRLFSREIWLTGQKSCQQQKRLCPDIGWRNFQLSIIGCRNLTSGMSRWRLPGVCLKTWRVSVALQDGGDRVAYQVTSRRGSRGSYSAYPYQGGSWYVQIQRGPRCLHVSSVRCSCGPDRSTECCKNSETAFDMNRDASCH